MRIPVIVLVAGMLGACLNLSGGSPCPSVYDFGLPVARLATDRPWSGLALEIRLPSWFDSLNIDYRLAYEDAQKQHEYSRSRWAGAPAVLLAQRLRQQLGVVGASGSGADCLLRIELQEFSQVFDSARSSRARPTPRAAPKRWPTWRTGWGRNWWSGSKPGSGDAGLVSSALNSGARASAAAT